MPDGSSSAAPVVRPGPNNVKYVQNFFLDDLLSVFIGIGVFIWCDDD